MLSVCNESLGSGRYLLGDTLFISRLDPLASVLAGSLDSLVYSHALPVRRALAPESESPPLAELKIANTVFMDELPS